MKKSLFRILFWIGNYLYDLYILFVFQLKFAKIHMAIFFTKIHTCV